MIAFLVSIFTQSFQGITIHGLIILLTAWSIFIQLVSYAMITGFTYRKFFRRIPTITSVLLVMVLTLLIIALLLF